ncbi:MAG: hypothetical protein JEY91_10130 [Spirochaetaceae bacterium]|nr:hypothetical protein [Spirochaetaceae bacterium]
MEEYYRDILIIGTETSRPLWEGDLLWEDLTILNIPCESGLSITEIERREEDIRIYGYSPESDILMIRAKAVILIPHCLEQACQALDLETGIIRDEKSGYPIIDSSMMTGIEGIFSFDSEPDRKMMQSCLFSVSRYLSGIRALSPVL